MPSQQGRYFVPKRVLITLVCITFSVLGSADAGVVSGSAKMAREAVENTARKLSDDVAVEQSKGLPKSVSKLPEPVRLSLVKLPQSEAVFVAKLLEDKKLRRVIPSDAADDAVAFLARNGENGARVLRRFGWRDATRHGLTRLEADAVVQEAALLIKPGLKGSWIHLRQALRNSGATGRQRDFAEVLFADRARAGRIPGLENAKLIPAQHNAVNGIDFLAIDDGRIRVIEFGTGKKPTPISGQDIGIQMDWPWIEKNLQKYLVKS